MASKSVDPEHLKTAKDLTIARYSKYGSGLGLKDEALTLTAFGVGAGAVVGIVYVRDEIIGDGGGGGGGGTGVSIPPGMLDVVDPAMAVLGAIPL